MITTEETLTEIAGNSSIPADAGNVIPDTETAKSTVDDTDKGEGQDAKDAADSATDQGDKDKDTDKGKDAKDAGDGKAGDGKKADPEPGDDGKKAPPYHKDPAWQRIIEERNEARAETLELRDKVSKLEGVVETIVNGTRTQKKEAIEDLPDILNMSDEEVEEKMTKDPKGLLGMLRNQIKHEVKKEQEASAEASQANERQKAVNVAYRKYADDNPDFETMWKKGDIQKYMDKNPGHTPISAHAMLTREASIKAEADRIVAEKTKEIEDNLLAKKRAGTLGARETPAARKSADGASDDKEALNDTKSKGGLTATLAARLKSLRQAAGQT